MHKIKQVNQLSNDNVLFLQGVYKKDCKRMEDMFREKIIENTQVQETIYDKIPVVYSSIDDWPRTINLCCWFCNRHFKTRPWFEPQSIEPVNEISDGRILDSSSLRSIMYKKQTSIVVKGVFCTCNCVRAYIELHTNDYADKLNKIQMLKYIYEQFTGKSIPDIQPSPHPTEMQQYGGKLTSSEYQQKIESLDYAYMRELEDNNFASICNIYLKQLKN
jgi:hypothetical protein